MELKTVNENVSYFKIQLCKSKSCNSYSKVISDYDNNHESSFNIHIKKRSQTPDYIRDIGLLGVRNK